MRKTLPYFDVGNLFLKVLVLGCFWQSALQAIEYHPWGKDAPIALQKKTPSEIKPVATPCLGLFAEKMIAFHREVISPCDGPRSHYEPSSSKYTLDAMRKYGFFTGFIKGCDRLMRENKDPWFYPKTIDRYGKLSKYDPA